jgi:hypothetical protein
VGTNHDHDWLLDQLACWLVCSSCLRIRHTPIHVVARLLGMCPGDRTWH